MIMKVTRYSFYFALIFTISFVMMISGNAVALGYEELEITGSVNLKSNTIEITGETTKIWEDVIFTVKSPNGNLMSVDQTTPQSNGYFGTNIGVGGSLWKQDGSYTITAQQGSNYQFRDSIQIRVVDGGIGVQFDKNVKYSDGCKLKTPPRWDKTAEKDQQFSISWDNPDTNICKYYVVMYDQNKNKSNFMTGQWLDMVNQIDITQNWEEQSYFKICNANENWCTNFIDVNVIDTTMNNALTMVGIVLSIVCVIGISGYVIYLKTKKSRTAIQTSSTLLPSSTEKPQEEDITYIDKQISLNEEKIRKIEEESRKLDE